MYLRKSLILLALAAIFVTACAGAIQEPTSPAGDTPAKQVDGSDTGESEMPVIPPTNGNNDLVAGGERSPLEPLPNEADMVRDGVQITSAEVLLLESFPVQVRLNVSGNLPTPCHMLRAEVNEPDTQNRIEVELYSLVEPDVICIQVIQPFESTIPLGEYPPGGYQVYLNGELVGEFTL